MNYTKEDIKEAIKQLQNLKFHSEGADVYEKNKKALKIAINVLTSELKFKDIEMELKALKKPTLNQTRKEYGLPEINQK